MKTVIPVVQVERRIYLIRGQKVMFDVDLAKLYGVPTKSLNLAVKRNLIRFPSDFMFQLTLRETKNLRFQIETSSWGGRRYLPRVFTEQGVAMLSSVLKSQRAAMVNIAVMRAFVRLRQIISTHKELANKLQQLENKMQGHDIDIQNIFGAIRRLMASPKKSTPKIGFKP